MTSREPGDRWRSLMQLMAATHTGMTSDEFQKIVTGWIATAQHPRFKRPYTQCVYQPMLELLAYLRANGFKTYIVSGGGIEFMRPWTERVYGIPPEQVIGSSAKTKFEIVNGQPVLMRLPEINFIDGDKASDEAAQSYQKHLSDALRNAAQGISLRTIQVSRVGSVPVTEIKDEL